MSPVPDPETSYVLRAFREFYAELARQRRAVLADPWPRAAAAGDESPGGAAPDARAVSGRLLALLERQALEAGRHGGHAGAGLYRDAQYVMAAVGDEVFLHLDWHGRDPWAGSLLESRLFGSQVAGERVFARVDHLLRDRDPVQRDLAAVYLMALSLGFQGRYRGSPGAHRLEEYRRELFGFVFRRQPSLVRGERRLFPRAYDHALRSAPPPPPRRSARWAGGLAGVLLGYLLLAEVAWRDVSRPVRAAATSLVEAVEDAAPAASGQSADFAPVPALEDARVPEDAQAMADPQVSGNDQALADAQASAHPRVPEDVQASDDQRTMDDARASDDQQTSDDPRALEDARSVEVAP
jgi:type VI secretion system protein ImpK